MVAVIGDIHGCLNTLKDLVYRIRQKYPAINIFSVGDLVDRGNFSYEVIEFIIEEKINFTAGNHDLMFYYFFEPILIDISPVLVTKVTITNVLQPNNSKPRRINVVLGLQVGPKGAIGNCARIIC